MIFSQTSLTYKLLTLLCFFTISFNSAYLFGQKAELTIIKNSNSQLEPLRHAVYGEFYEGKVTDLETKVLYEIDEDLAYVYLLKSESESLRIFIPSNLKADIVVNGKIIKVLASNSSEFSAYVRFQNFFLQQINNELNSFGEIAISFVKRLDIIDSLYNKLRTDLNKDEHLEVDFLTFLDLEFKYLKMKYVKGQLLYSNKKFGKVDPAFPDRIMRGDKEFKKLAKHLEKEYPVALDLNKQLVAPAFIDYLADNFSEKFFSDPDIADIESKYISILIKREAKKFSSLFQSLIFLNHLNVFKKFDFVRYADIFTPYIIEVGVKRHFNKRLEHVDRENEEFLTNYVFKEREQQVLSASSAIEGLNDFLEVNKGKVILIDFWATWCGPCIANFPYSNKIKEELVEENIAFLYVCMDAAENSEKALEIIDKYNLGGNHIIVEDKMVNKETVKSHFAIKYYPTYKIIDQDGIVIDLQHVQPRMGDGEDLKGQLLEVLNR